MFAQSLDERVALNKITVKLLSSAETEEKCQKTFCVNITCEQMFSNHYCVMREYFCCIDF